MKKAICLILTLVFVLATLTACGSAASTQTAASAGSNPANTAADSNAASDFPSSAITLINTSDAGSASDIMARAAAQVITENSGVNIMVDDKPGGSGAVGTTYVTNSANDGYTILMSLYGHTLLNAALNDVGYTNDSFTHICMLASAPFCFAVRPDTFVSYDEMVAAFKSGETYNVGVPGASSGPAVFFNMFLDELGIGDNVQVIPYDSGSAASAALMGGDLDVTCLPCSESMKYHESGELKVLLVCGDTPHFAAPDIPTAADAGLECRGELWYGISAPAGLDESIVDFYEKQFKAAFDSSVFQDTLNSIGAIPVWMGHTEFSDYCANQWAQLTALGK